MRAALRLGTRLATSRSGDEAWRTALVGLCACVTAVTWLIGMSVRHEVGEENRRVAGRAPVLTGSSDTGLPSYRDVLDAVAGRQFTVRWLDVTEGDPLPPGLDPATFFRHRFTVSPGLASALRASGSDRFSPYAVIEGEGLRNLDELFAYARVPVDPSRRGVGWSFDSFGSEASWAGTDIEIFPLTVGIAAFLVLPCLVLFGVGCTVQGDQHSYRCQLLGRLGVPRRHIALLGAAEAGAPAGVGALVGAMVHGLWSRHTSTVPVLGRHVVEGDLVVPPTRSGAIILVVAALGAGLGAVVAVLRSRPNAFNRPVRSDVPMGPLRLLPFAAGLLLMMIGLVQTGSGLAPYTILSGGLLIVGGVPLVLPLVAGLAGGMLATSESLTLFMIGRRFQRDPRHAMRPLLVLGAALSLIILVIGYLSVVRFDDEPQLPLSELQAVTFRYVSPAPVSALDRLSTQEVLVAPIDSRTGRIELSCVELERLLPSPCTVEQRLTDEARSAIARALALPPPFAARLDIGSVGPSESVSGEGIALGRSQAQFGDAIRSHLERAGFVAPEVTDRRELAQAESPLVAWILAGLTTAVVIGVTALLVLVVERYVRSIKDHRILGVIGLSPSQQWAVETVQFAVAYNVAVVVAMLFGTVGTMTMTRSAFVPFPAMAVVATFGYAVGAGLIALLGVGIVARVRVGFDDLYRADSGRSRWIS